jgi:hypothetical protein
MSKLLVHTVTENYLYRFNLAGNPVKHWGKRFKYFYIVKLLSNCSYIIICDLVYCSVFCSRKIFCFICRYILNGEYCTLICSTPYFPGSIGCIYIYLWTIAFELYHENNKMAPSKCWHNVQRCKWKQIQW